MQSHAQHAEPISSGVTEIAGDHIRSSDGRATGGFVFVNRPPWNAWFWPGLYIALPAWFLVQAARGELEFQEPLSDLIGFVAACAFFGLVFGAHMFAGRQRRITIDFTQRIVRFENFRFQRGYSKYHMTLSITAYMSAIRPIREQVYAFDEIMRVRRVYHLSGLAHLHITTNHGRIIVSKYGRNFKELELFMHSIAQLPPGPPENGLWAYKRVFIPVVGGIMLILLLLTLLFDLLRPILDGLG